MLLNELSVNHVHLKDARSRGTVEEGERNNCLGGVGISGIDLAGLCTQESIVPSEKRLTPCELFHQHEKFAQKVKAGENGDGSR